MSADVVRSHLRVGELTLARAAATSAIESASGPERPLLLALLARVEVRLGRPRAAMRAAEAAAAASEAWEVRLALGEALVATGEPLAARAQLAALHDALRADSALPAVVTATALSHACRAAGDPATGLGLAERAVALGERVAGPASPEVADALHALGVCRWAAGHPDDARDALVRALDIRRAHGETVEVATLLDALGRVDRADRRPFDAVARHRSALGLWTRLLGRHASPVGACRHALAQALHRTGDFLAARDEMAAALDVTARTLGDDHVDTWITRFELARYDVDTGRMERGFADMERARAVVRDRLGPDHPVVAAMDRFL